MIFKLFAIFYFLFDSSFSFQFQELIQQKDFPIQNIGRRKGGDNCGNSLLSTRYFQDTYFAADAAAALSELKSYFQQILKNLFCS